MNRRILIVITAIFVAGQGIGAVHWLVIDIWPPASLYALGLAIGAIFQAAIFRAFDWVEAAASPDSILGNRSGDA